VPLVFLALESGFQPSALEISYCLMGNRPHRPFQAKLKDQAAFKLDVHYSVAMSFFSPRALFTISIRCFSCLIVAPINAELASPIAILIAVLATKVLSMTILLWGLIIGHAFFATRGRLFSPWVEGRGDRPRRLFKVERPE